MLFKFALTTAIALSYFASAKDIFLSSPKGKIPVTIRANGFTARVRLNKRDISDDDRQRYLDGHNALRSHHDSPEMTWDDDLANFAQSVVSTCNYEHSGGDYGENIGAGSFTPEQIVQAFYDEIQNYDFNNPQFSPDTGHFTQLVWRDSTRLGCAVQDCEDLGGQFMACEYDPSGNWAGEFPANVWPCQHDCDQKIYD